MIDKYALVEAKALIRTHTAIINAWAFTATDSSNEIAPSTKEALLDAAARLYELIEGLKTPEERKLQS